MYENTAFESSVQFFVGANASSSSSSATPGNIIRRQNPKSKQ